MPIASEQLSEIKKNCAPAEVLAVSKLQSVEKIRALYELGQRSFAENYVQGALDKQDILSDLTDLKWHLIGHLQKNKAKYVVGKFALIHSVDSFELAQILSRQCETKGVQQRILLQINIANEASKQGFSAEQALSYWDKLQSLPDLHILGLMTMPPLTEDPQEVRPYFRALKLLKEELKNSRTESRHTLEHLSMGTSHDFKVAIEEGSSIVRLGTILFGARPG